MRLLEGLVGLDLADLKGQFCGKILADLGMEVIKVEPPIGDPVRRLGPFARNGPGQNEVFALPTSTQARKA